MARGTRAPSQSAYRGAIGKTQTATVHVTGAGGELVPAQVYTSIDALTDPELVERLHADDPGRALNVVRTDAGEPIRIAVPVVYHDPAAELLVLVLTDAHRHRELDERIRLLERLREDPAPVPAYAKEFSVVYGAAGLRTHLEHRAQEMLEKARAHDATRELDRRGRELDQRAQELDRRGRELDQRAEELERRLAELAAAEAEIERSRAELRSRVIAAVAQPAASPMTPPAGARSAREDEATRITERPTGEPETRPLARATLDEIEASLRAVGEAPAPAAAAFELDEETTGSATIPQGSDPVTTETFEQALGAAGAPDPSFDRATARDGSTISVDPEHGVRLVLVAGEQLARGLGGALDVRLLLHRTQVYPVITLIVGPPSAFRAPRTPQLAIVPLDIADEAHRAVLIALARSFELTIDLVVRGHGQRRVKLAAPLAENVGYILRAADDHLRGLASSAMTPGDEAPSFARGRDLVLGAGFDLLGTEHPDAAEFRDDKLAQLETAQHLRRAIAMARRFARPSREDYLVCTRGYPLPRWRELRRQVLQSAVAWGLWMGPELAQVAVSEGLARSRRDLVTRLHRGFEALKRDPAAFDIDADAAEDNAKALAEEARALGVELPRPTSNGKPGGAIKSDEVSQVSGSIGATSSSDASADTPAAQDRPRARSTDELLAELEDRERRVAAALELCERAEPRAAAPVIAAATKMSRNEAVRVLGMCVKFGPVAAKPLQEGLESSKAFLRHGCALALALLRTEEGTQAVIDLLLREPTEIWREVARALGQVGPTGLMPLASNYGRLGEAATPQLSERVAWAMAHIAVRGGKAAVDVMANGHSVVAPVARHALELFAVAAQDHVRVRPGAGAAQAGRDVTVNRAFSRRFFEALEQGLPDAAQAGLQALDASSPMELLDEADLIDEDEAELDDADLIQT